MGSRIKVAEHLNDIPYELPALIYRALVNGQCSTGLIAELEPHFNNGTMNVHSIITEIAYLEGAACVAGSSSTKKEAPFKGRWLRGLWHKHHIHELLPVWWTPS